MKPVFRELVRAGLDVARLNFSHGTHPEKLKLIEMVRKVSSEEGKPICILGDLQGPKIRTGRLKNRIPVQLKAGQRLTITPARYRRHLHPDRHHLPYAGGKSGAGGAHPALRRPD